MDILGRKITVPKTILGRKSTHANTILGRKSAKPTMRYGVNKSSDGQPPVPNLEKRHP